MLLGQAAAALPAEWRVSLAAAVAPQLHDEMQRLARLFAVSRADPTRAYAYCFCSPD
jgi:hypothetical protein